MSDQELDRAMRRALLDAAARDLAVLEAQPLCACAPSRRHRREMRAMLRDPLRWAKRREQSRPKAPLARAAAVLLAVLLGLCALTLCIPSARAAVLRWFLTWTDPAHFTYHYTGDAPAEALPRYEITALPEGFAEVERNAWPDAQSMTIHIVYKNSENDIIYFDYNFIFESNVISFGIENAEQFDVEIGNLRGKYIQAQTPQGISHVTWIDEESNIQFHIAGMLSEASILHIAESVSLVKSTK